MKEDWRSSIKDLVKKAGKGKIMLLIGVGILLLAVSVWDGKEEKNSQSCQKEETEERTSDEMQQYREKMEKQVQEILEQ